MLLKIRVKGSGVKSYTGFGFKYPTGEFNAAPLRAVKRYQSQKGSPMVENGLVAMQT